MIIDINTYIGHWPFRQVNNSTPRELVKIMDNAGIDIAAVSSINSVFYKDSQQGNEELVKEIAAYKNRFIPFAIINPAYTGWKKDFVNCIDKMEMKGLELYPYYHQYSLTDSSAVELMQIAAEKKVPVHLPYSIVNIRQRHWLDTNRNLSIDEVEKVLSMCPNTDFIITSSPADGIAKQFKKVVENRPGRVYYDFSRLDVFTQGFNALVETAGIDRIVFGSVSPFQYVDPQLVKLHFSDLNDCEKGKVMSGNLKELLGLNPDVQTV